MKTLSHPALTWCFMGIFLLATTMYSCDHIANPDIRDRNNAMDGDDTKQRKQNQDSVNRVLNEHNGGAIDTLPEGLQE
jgi:hypothetical protein